jgi:hypothetical protein
MHSGLDIRIDDSYKPFENHIIYSYNILLKEILAIFEGSPIQFVYSGHLSNINCSEKATIQIIPSHFFCKRSYLSKGSLPKTPILWVDAAEALFTDNGVCDSKIPVLFGGERNRQIYVKKLNNALITNADLIASTFFMLTRYEEIIVDLVDEYGRFPFIESLAYKEDFFHRPIVNEYAELFWDWIFLLVPQARRKRKTYQLRLTHDVDQVKKYSSIPKALRISASLAIKHRQPRKAINHLTGMIKTRLRFSKDPFDCYDELMDISEQQGGKSCFYFMAEEAKSPDEGYEIMNPEVVRIIESILRRGHDIGLHPGRGSYCSLEKLQLQKEKLDKVLGYSNYGGRQHYLQWKSPDTWRLYEKVGLTHDSSVGYAETPGFRCGMCMPFHVFDAKAGKQLNLRELPLITMDSSVYSSKYNSPYKTAHKEALLDSIKENTKRVSGNYCILWHNTSSDTYGTDTLRNLINC